MLADVIEIAGERIEIHVINLIDHDYFSIYALDSSETRVQGMEIQIKKPFKMDLLEFSLQEHTRSVVSFLKRQIEIYGLEPWRTEAIDNDLQQQNSVDDLFSAGRKAFLADKHYRINPFIDVNPFRRDEWHKGWLEESMKHPDRFNFEADTFNENLSEAPSTLSD